LRAEEFASPKELDARLFDIAKKRIAHGYRIVEAQGSTARYRVLEDILGIARSHGALEAAASATLSQPAPNEAAARPGDTEKPKSGVEPGFQDEAQQLKLGFESDQLL
jgi:hypothetical protein